MERTLNTVENDVFHSAIRKARPDQQNRLDALRRRRAPLDREYIALRNGFTTRGYDRIPAEQRQRWRDQNVPLSWQPEITENQRKQALEQADMAEGAYGGEKAVGPWKPEKVWEHSDKTPGVPNGFRAVLYRNQETGTFVLAFAGTDDIHDVVTDAQQVLGIRTRQYLFAMKLGELIADDPQYANGSPANLVFVEHSLGGGLATVASAATGAKAAA